MSRHRGSSARTDVLGRLLSQLLSASLLWRIDPDGSRRATPSQSHATISDACEKQHEGCGERDIRSETDVRVANPLADATLKHSSGC